MCVPGWKLITPLSQSFPKGKSLLKNRSSNHEIACRPTRPDFAHDLRVIRDFANKDTLSYRKREKQTFSCRTMIRDNTKANWSNARTLFNYLKIQRKQNGHSVQSVFWVRFSFVRSNIEKKIIVFTNSNYRSVRDDNRVMGIFFLELRKIWTA